MAKKGQITPLETRRKMSLSQKGKPRQYLLGNKHRLGIPTSAKQKQIARKLWTGENNPNWKGGYTKYPHEHTKSAMYKSWRKLVFERDNYTCQLCSKKGVFLHPHHKVSYTHYPDVRYNVNNGITLCVFCHKSIN